VKRILVVDDEEAILDAARDYLGAHGYAVDCAREREEAEALISANPPYDVVITDMRLTGTHGREGLELVSWLRERSPSSKAIILTAFASPELEKECRRRGADGFLEKPVPLSELAATAARLLEGGRA